MDVKTVIKLDWRAITVGGNRPLNTKAMILAAKAMIEVILCVQEALYAD